jgi:hypothetical protein
LPLKHLSLERLDERVLAGLRRTRRSAMVEHFGERALTRLVDIFRSTIATMFMRVPMLPHELHPS